MTLEHQVHSTLGFSILFGEQRGKHFIPVTVQSESGIPGKSLGQIDTAALNSAAPDSYHYRPSEKVTLHAKKQRASAATQATTMHELGISLVRCSTSRAQLLQSMLTELIRQVIQWNHRCPLTPWLVVSREAIRITIPTGIIQAGQYKSTLARLRTGLHGAWPLIHWVRCQWQLCLATPSVRCNLLPIIADALRVAGLYQLWHGYSRP